MTDSFRALFLLLATSWLATAIGADLPQHGWYLERSWSLPGEPNFISVDRDGTVYTYESGDGFGVRIFDENGTWLNPAPDNFSQVPRIVPNMLATSMTIDPFGDPAVDRVVIFGGRSGSDGLIETCLAVPFNPGVNDNGCTSASGIVQSAPQAGTGGFGDVDVADDGSIYAIGLDSSEVTVFDSGLVAMATIGVGDGSGAPGTLANPQWLEIDEFGSLWIVDEPNLNEFRLTGEFVRRFEGLGSYRLGLAVGFGELWLVRQLSLGAGGGYAQLALSRDYRFEAIGGIHGPTSGGNNNPFAMAFAGPDILYLGYIINGEPGVAKYRRAYRTYEPTLAAVPVPQVLEAGSLTGTTDFRVRYRVVDADSPAVTVDAVALADGVVSLAAAIPIDSVVSGALGASVATGVDNEFVWDAGTDLAGQGDFINASIRVMARDDRTGLLDLHLITIPSAVCADTQMGGDLVINASPVSDLELLDAWLWLIATDDPGITFANGEVRDVGNGDLLASGTTTTPEGRAFIFDRVGAREADLSEVQCAAEATTPGIVNQFVPGNRFGPRPDRVNEFGFDTGNTVTGYHAVLQ